MKLIDKDAVVAEIKGYISNYKEIVAKTNRNDSTWVDSISIIDTKIDVLQHVLFFLNTLEVKEVNLEKEIEEYLSIYWPNEKDLHPFLGHVAKHFFELGLSHSVDESIVRKIVDLYFEASKHYDEVIKQERNENGGSQLAIGLLNGSKDIKELCVQYVLNKVTKE